MPCFAISNRICVVWSCAAGPGAADAFKLPVIQHAPGFEKYAAIEAGALAHEAGYDAFMTGAAPGGMRCTARQCHRPLLGRAHATVAVDRLQPTASVHFNSSLLLYRHVRRMSRYSFLRPAGAAFACLAHLHTALDAAALSTASTGAACAAQADSDNPPAAAGRLEAADPLAAVERFKGRINVMRTDMPFAAFSGPDPPLARPHVFYIHDISPGTRVADICRVWTYAGLGRVRITFQGNAAALVEMLDPQGTERYK